MTTLATFASVDKAIGHTRRLHILAMLRGGVLSVCQITTVLDAPVSTVSGHLLELRHVDLVHESRRGKWVYYRLTNTETLVAVVTPILKVIDTDPDVQRDAAIAATLRGQSPAPACEAAAADALQVQR